MPPKNYKISSAFSYNFKLALTVEKLAEQYGWSPSVPNLSDKLRCESLRYKEAVELADALGYDLVWQKRR